MQLEAQRLILREYTMDDFDAFLKFQRARIDDLEEIFQLYKNGKWIYPDSRFCIIHRLR